MESQSTAAKRSHKESGAQLQHWRKKCKSSSASKQPSDMDLLFGSPERGFFLRMERYLDLQILPVDDNVAFCPTSKHMNWRRRIERRKIDLLIRDLPQKMPPKGSTSCSSQLLGDAMVPVSLTWSDENNRWALRSAKSWANFCVFQRKRKKFGCQNL